MIMTPDAPPPPFMIATKTPITIGIGVTGNESEIAMYVPNALIKEVTGMIMMFIAPPMPQGGPGAPETAPSPSNEF